MADGADTRVNLAALKRVDPYAVEIVETGTQVAIYKFNSQSNEWEKTDVEGTLFLYARSGDPKHGFVVMNRLSTENLVEPITKDLEIQLQAPFLLYKNANFAITGVWFYEESECVRIAKRLENLVKEESQRPRPQPPQDRSSVDILSLLTKAQGEYEQKGKPSVPVSTSNAVDVVRPTAVRATTNGVATAHSTPSSHGGLSVADLFGTTEPSAAGAQMPIHHCGSLFERLLSTTPTGVPPPPLAGAELHTAQSLERELCGKEKSKTTNGVGEKGLPHAAPIRPNSVQPGGLSAQVVRGYPIVADVIQAASATPPRHAGVQPVALMSPMMFASASVTTEPHTEVARIQTPVHRQVFPPKEEPIAAQSEEVTPLTKAQLMQAFNYLLKNDSNFITQLHDAYVQSLKQSLKH